MNISLILKLKMILILCRFFGGPVDLFMLFYWAEHIDTFLICLACFKGQVPSQEQGYGGFLLQIAFKYLFLVYACLVHKLQKKKLCKERCLLKLINSEVLNVITSCCYNIITIQRFSHLVRLTLLPGFDLSCFCGFYCSAQLHVRSESSTCFQERIRGFFLKKCRSYRQLIVTLATEASYK